MSKFKFGKKAPHRLMSTPSLGDFMTKATEWPAVPAMGWEAKVADSDWGVLGNSTWGCCAEAGLMHLVQAQSANVGNPLHSTEAQTLALYSAATGFNPNDPESDQGTVLSEILGFIKKNGLEMLDSTDKTVTVEIVGFASLDISSISQTRYATYIFGGSYLGINCPQQCEDDLSNWNFGPGLPLAGGHCISRVGEGSAGGKIVSWGKVIPFSNQFWTSYGDEGYIVLTKAWINDQNKSPSGLDLDGLLAAMKSL